MSAKKAAKTSTKKVAKKMVTDAKAPTPKPTTTPKRWPKTHVALLVVIAVLLVGLLLGAIDKKDSGSIGGAKLKNVGTYHSDRNNLGERTKSSNFKTNDSIQVGFDYEGEDIDEQEALISFVVYNQETGDEAFRTNKFRLMNDENELFVNVNNTNLPAGDYRVELQNSDGNKVAETSYSISE